MKVSDFNISLYNTWISTEISNAPLDSNQNLQRSMDISVISSVVHRFFSVACILKLYIFTYMHL